MTTFDPSSETEPEMRSQSALTRGTPKTQALSPMPGCARNKLLLGDRAQMVHRYTRCVGREFLAGIDPLTGKDINYRRDWIRSLPEQQAALFGIETFLMSCTLFVNNCWLRQAERLTH